MNQAIIQIRGLTKTFRTGLRRRRSTALCGLDLEVSAGEIFGFLGPNGAGKTTTIKILVGLLRSDSGEALLFGQPASEAKVRRRLAYLPELPDFYDYLTPQEFLFHCGQLSGLARSALRQKVFSVLERVGLDPNEKRQLRKFSKGMLQRVGIAQALIADPDLYIFDEPMGGLDPLGRRWLKDLIAELGKKGKTVFFSSHILSEAEAVCDRVAFLRQGKLLVQGSLREILRTTQGGWEVVVEGKEVLQDQSVHKHASSVEPIGPDSLLVPADPLGPSELLRLLLAHGYRIQSVNQRHASLEEVFIRSLDVHNTRGGA